MNGCKPLASGQGAAVVIYPASGTLPANGEVRATLTLVGRCRLTLSNPC